MRSTKPCVQYGSRDGESRESSREKHTGARGELRECTKPPLSRGNRGVLCAFRHRGIMHRAHDRPTDRQTGPCRKSGPRDEVFFRPRNPSDLFAALLHESDPENIISNPSEGKIYESSSSRRIGASCGARNRLPGRSTSFSAGFPFARIVVY